MNKNIFTKRFEELADSLAVDQVDKLNALLELNFTIDGEVHGYKPYCLSEFIFKSNKENENSLIIKQTLVTGFIIKNWDIICSKEMSENLQGAYRVYIRRVMLMVSDTSFNTDDIFWKELAVARLQFFPLHSGVMELYSGYGIKQGFGGSILSSLHFCLLLIRYGRKPYYQIHTHTPVLANFNPEGWIKSYLQVADNLKVNPHIKGLIRGSWFFDPKIKIVSPRLSYLQDLPLENGAKVFCIGDDESGNALAKSKSRLTLYNKGKYTPKSYLLIWHRDAILSWAERYRDQTRD